MKAKTAYLWGPVSTFAAPLAAWLVAQGWHVHVATKSALNLLSLSSLDITSSAKDALEEVFGTRNKFRAFHERLKFFENGDFSHGTKYDAVIFCGLPPNFDDARVPRACWAAAELPNVLKHFKGVPLFMVSSLWGAVQADGIVPEELEFARRKANHHWEKTCQNYELKLIEELPKIESNWYFIRLPLITGSTANGYSFASNGLANLFAALDPEFNSKVTNNAQSQPTTHLKETVTLAHQPNATLWFLPVDVAVYMFWRYLEDETRPRICNFVSAQAMLNGEWLQYLAQALGVGEIIPAAKDTLQLPLVLKKLLLDNVQVNKRNLFEVTGRYQLRPEKLDSKYFAKLIQIGREKNWGKNNVTTIKNCLDFSIELVSYYFEEFLPAHLSGALAQKMTQTNTSIGFKLKDISEPGWILRTTKPGNGKTAAEHIFIERYTDTSEKPKVCFILSGKSLIRLMQNKVSIQQALLLKEIEAEGSLFDTLRASKVLSQFMNEYPLQYSPQLRADGASH